MPRSVSRARLGTAAALLAAAVLAGCDDTPPRKEVHPVVGKLLVSKRPVKGIDLTFIPAAELNNPRALRSMATTAEDGTFTVTTYGSGDGVPAGEFVVLAYWAGPLPRDATPSERGPDRLKGRYHNPGTTPLRVNIQPGQNELPVIDLSAP